MSKLLSRLLRILFVVAILMLTYIITCTAWKDGLSFIPADMTYREVTCSLGMFQLNTIIAILLWRIK